MTIQEANLLAIQHLSKAVGRLACHSDTTARLETIQDLQCALEALGIRRLDVEESAYRVAKDLKESSSL